MHLLMLSVPALQHRYGFLGRCTCQLPAALLPLDSDFQLVLPGTLADRGSLLVAQDCDGRTRDFNVGSAQTATTAFFQAHMGSVSAAACLVAAV